MDNRRLIKPTRSSIRLDLSGAYVDLFAFDEAIRRGDLASLREAVGLYRGDLLTGCNEPWVGKEREERRQSCERALQTLIEDAQDNGAFEEAEHYLRLHIALDGLKTARRCELMRLLARRGEYHAAIQVVTQWHALVSDPRASAGDEIEALYRDLRNRVRPPKRSQADAPNAATRPAQPYAFPHPIGQLIGDGPADLCAPCYAQRAARRGEDAACPARRHEPAGELPGWNRLCRSDRGRGTPADR
jgi:DNA-binding SARP family transcriptional activator